MAILPIFSMSCPHYNLIPIFAKLWLRDDQVRKIEGGGFVFS